VFRGGGGSSMEVSVWVNLASGRAESTVQSRRIHSYCESHRIGKLKREPVKGRNRKNTHNSKMSPLPPETGPTPSGG